jgi:hypothetical protein
MLGIIRQRLNRIERAFIVTHDVTITFLSVFIRVHLWPTL